MEDLSQQHHPVGQLFGASASPEDALRHRLSPEQVQFFHEQGYLAGVRLLSDAQVDALGAEVAALAEPDHPRR
jgi:hypothetical protein